MQKSFLKFKDSNNKILEDLIPLIESFKNKKLKEQTLIEPFLGSGSVFLNIKKFENFILNDLNVNIFMLFNQIKQNPQTLIEDSKKIFNLETNQSKYFEKISNDYNKSNDYYEMCKMYIYLNRHSLSRFITFNEEGTYVGKFGKYMKPYFPENEINLMNNKLNNTKVQIFNYSFERIFDNLEYGDVVYCDPPDIKNLNEFNYNQHNLLTSLAITSCLKGAIVLISNTYNETTKELYKDCSEYYIKKVKSNTHGKQTNKEEIIAIYA